MHIQAALQSFQLVQFLLCLTVINTILSQKVFKDWDRMISVMYGKVRNWTKYKGRKSALNNLSKKT